MRGRLIYWFVAELHRLDAGAMAALDPDGAGPLASGLDPDFLEPVRVDRDDDGLGETGRMEHTPVQVPCQVEPEVLEALRMLPGGQSSRGELRLVLHFRDLERLGLVDSATGVALVQPGDRLGVLRDRQGGLVQAFRDPPGMYVTETRATGFGLGRARPRRNLLLVTFEARRQAAGRR
ncbi:MAG: hypothetical protein RBU30_26225 [Polyangia bacterium]|jgi:hypothetical protein|nr:hypothetical protein [Polyangia bacterium]